MGGIPWRGRSRGLDVGRARGFFAPANVPQGQGSSIPACDPFAGRGLRSDDGGLVPARGCLFPSTEPKIARGTVLASTEIRTEFVEGALTRTEVIEA